MTSPDKPWTGARLGSLTGSQVKELLSVAQSPSAAATVEEAERLLADLCHAHGASHPALLEKAADPATAVVELTRLKDLAKALIKIAPDGSAREAARLLYHSSVAAAYVHHGAEISGRPMRKQQEVYERMAAQWTGHAIGDLFADAAARVAHATK
jgi:hypothetical protein